MKAGRVTEFAKKRFEEGNHHVNEYLAQVSDPQHNSFAQTADLVQAVSKVLYLLFRPI